MKYMKDVFPHISNKIFQNFSTEDLFNAGLTCKTWKIFTDEVYEKKGMIVKIFNIYYYGNYLQGDPNQNVKFLLAITLKICISDPMLVKPKCV